MLTKAKVINLMGHPVGDREDAMGIHQVNNGDLTADPKWKVTRATALRNRLSLSPSVSRAAIHRTTSI